MKFQMIVGIAIILVIASQVSAYDLNPQIYLNEFTNGNETCSYNDAFFYTSSTGILTFNVMYECGINNESRIVLPFDIMNKEIYEFNDEVELFHAAYAKEAIKKGDINPDNYYPQSVDICNYFGKKFNEQSTSLVIGAGEKFTPEKYRQTFKIIKNAGYATGLISEFNIGIFLLSVTCKKMSKVEEEAFLKVGECYQNIMALESGTTYYGQTSAIISCNEQSKTMLKAIIDSWGQQLKNLANTMVAVGKAFFWDPIVNVLNGSRDIPTFKVTPTSYEVVQQVYNKISSENIFFKNPNANIMSERAISRFNQKYNKGTSAYYPLLDRYHNYSLNISSKFSEVLSNTFLKPNVYQENERSIIKSVKNNLNLMADLINERRYNSAINLGNSVSLQFSELNKTLINNPLPEQKIDWLTIIVILLLIVVIIYFAIKFLS